MPNVCVCDVTEPCLSCCSVDVKRHKATLIKESVYLRASLQFQSASP